MHLVKGPGASRFAKRKPRALTSCSYPTFHLSSVPVRVTANVPSCDSSRAQLWLVNVLAQSFVADKQYCSADARRVLLSDDLPLGLERVAMHIEPNRQVWLAWANERQTWFVVAELAPGNTAQDTAIRIFFYDLDGVLLASGVWTLHSNGTWDLASIDNRL